MKYTEAKQKVEALLADAKARLEAYGVMADSAVEVVENEVEGGEVDILKVFGSIGVGTAELTEDEIFYLSMDLDVYDEEIDDEDYNAAEKEFGEALGELTARLEGADDKSGAIRELGREIDEALERAHREELERTDRATRRDLTVAVIALVALILVAFGCMLISKLAG